MRSLHLHIVSLVCVLGMIGNVAQAAKRPVADVERLTRALKQTPGDMMLRCKFVQALLEKKKDFLKEGIIILLVINFLAWGVASLCSCGRMGTHEHKVVIDPKVKKFRKYEALAFFRITDGKDTCLVSDFLDSFRERLNIKELNQESFDANYSMKILDNEVIEVPEEYYREEKKYCVTPVDAITTLYNNYGIYNFVYYLYQYPINKLAKEDMASFDWAVYLLWQNGIYVSLDEEVNCWYICGFPY